ncbi:MAG: hypothetical protein GF365_00395 [Candidatus Buchananbacteria bacterium]|nr:hypothetical protein [Candidatus Buchananbacteria bacterium]
MPNFEKPPIENKYGNEKKFIMGAKKKPDGTMDYSAAVTFTPKDEKDKKTINELREQDIEIIKPRGWTYLKHGTNFAKWQGTDLFNKDELELKKPLSVITQEEWERDIKQGSYDTTKNYSSLRKPKNMTEEQHAKLNKPFEIRVLFYKNFVNYRKTDEEYYNSLDQESKDLIKKYYLLNEQHGRHPVVPKSEKLIKLAHRIENGVDVFYFVPKSVEKKYIIEANIENN